MIITSLIFDINETTDFYVHKW